MSAQFENLEPLVDAAFQVQGATFKSLFANAAPALDCRRARGDIELLGPSDS
jgi:hypothetical protein